MPRALTAVLALIVAAGLAFASTAMAAEHGTGPQAFATDSERALGSPTLL